MSDQFPNEPTPDTAPAEPAEITEVSEPAAPPQPVVAVEPIVVESAAPSAAPASFELPAEGIDFLPRPPQVQTPSLDLPPDPNAAPEPLTPQPQTSYTPPATPYQAPPAVQEPTFEVYQPTEQPAYSWSAQQQPIYPGAQLQPAPGNTTIASAAHWGTLLGSIFAPVVGSIAVPAIILGTKGQQDSFVRDNAKEALNFGITTSIGLIACYILMATIIGIPVAFVLWAVIAIVALIFHTQGSSQASRGQVYKYPFSIRLVK
ncbi:MAG: DUF4870 domain-containing protein [Propionibacteriaceae bacterium]|jgi:uncharacterized Tic20 family protein|nr:DUF4870 domain-containing protein [Propionibacteriaceae bacterium]